MKTTKLSLVIPGKPVPLQRSRTSKGRHYLPKRSRDYRELIQTEWVVAGGPSIGGEPFVLSARFYGARANADLDNMVKSLLDALNGLAFFDDKQLVCLTGVQKLPGDAQGPRVEMELQVV